MKHYIYILNQLSQQMLRSQIKNEILKQYRIYNTSTSDNQSSTGSSLLKQYNQG